MKRILFSIIYTSLFLGCSSQSTKENQDKINNPLKDAEFIISDKFIIADDETFSAYLKETLSELNIEDFSKNSVGLSDESWQKVMMEWKETTKLYLRKNATDNGENIVIKYSEVGPSEFWLNKLTTDMKKQESAFSKTTGMNFEMIDSGMKKYKNRYSYIYFISKISFEGMSRYGLQCIISVNNKSYQVIINTYEKLLFEDVVTNIK